ncbi:hypothetical protein OHA72_22360 [Dactylosporangium sp. NBC_01737]|uniref:hypothetical protein n=1 Tax=Dactylosporangium sp. NBC_01737 TaxID=2975959 RepID=UPI002E13C805|nr:hypothetical protein OHA72_22360 [Dactylosporangium sp. NBC_01737]
MIEDPLDHGSSQAASEHQGDQHRPAHRLFLPEAVKATPYVANRRALPYERPVYPLLDHQPPLRRLDCERITAAAGLPVPGKSACWFCPLHRRMYWSELRRDRPDMFERSCQLEELLNERRARLGRDPVWLTARNRPLRTLDAAQDPLLGFESEGDDGSCDNGACFT